MRDEFMNVEGQASTDEDMFASLRERSVEIEESQDAAEAENVDDVSGNEQENSRENTEDSDFSGVDDLFAASSAVFSSDIRPSTDVTAKANLESPDELAERSKPEEDNDSPAMASDEDIEKLKRMFGGGE